MPQGPAELHEKWEDDGRAIQHLLDKGFRTSRGGVIYHPDGIKPDDEARSAIDYLCLEWDYGYDNRNTG